MTALAYEVVQVGPGEDVVLARFHVNRDAIDYCKTRSRRLYDTLRLEVHRLDDANGREKRLGVYNGKVQSRTNRSLHDD